MSASDGIPGILVNDAPEPLNVVAVQVPVTVNPPAAVSAFFVPLWYISTAPSETHLSASSLAEDPVLK